MKHEYAKAYALKNIAGHDLRQPQAELHCVCLQHRNTNLNTRSLTTLLTNPCLGFYLILSAIISINASFYTSPPTTCQFLLLLPIHFPAI